MKQFDPVLARLATELRSGPRDSSLRRVTPGVEPVLRRNDFARPYTRQNGRKCFGRAFFQLNTARRNIARRHAYAVADRGQRSQHIGASWVEQRLLGKRARRDETHDVARYQRLRPASLLGFFGGFDLLGDGDALTRLDQPRQIPFRRMDRYAAHRDGRALVLPPAGQRDVQHARRNFRVFEEQFEEVAHTIEQQAIAGLGLETQVLFDHRGSCGRHAARRPNRMRSDSIFPRSRFPLLPQRTFR